MEYTQEEIAKAKEIKARGGTETEARLAVARMRSGVAPVKPLSVGGGYSLSETGGDIFETIKGIGSQWGQAGKDIHTRITGGTVSPNDTAYNPRNLGSALKTGVEVGGDILRGVGRTFDELYIGTGKVALTQNTEDKVKDFFVSGMEKVLETGVAQDVVQMYQNLDPETKNNLDTFGGYVEGLLELVPAVTAHKLFNRVKSGQMSVGQLDDLVSFIDDVSPQRKALQLGDNVIPEGTATREVVEEVGARVKRGYDDVLEAVSNKKALSQELIDKTPTYAEARRVGWSPQELSTVIETDDVTRRAMKEAQKISEGGEAIARTQKATDIAGNYMDNVYQTLESHRKSVGGQLGDAIKQLDPDITVNMRPAYNQIDDVLRQNGVVIRNGKVIDAPTYSDAQLKVIREAYSKFQGDDVLNATTVHAKDRTFGQLQREAYSMLDKQPVLVSTPRGEVDIVTLMRDVYRSPLDTISPEIRKLNKSYALARNATDDISNTVRRVNKNLNVPVDQSAKTGNLLRRIDSRALSAEDFRAVAETSYIRARALGYEGADPVALIQFTDDIAPLYATPASQPPTGFIGSLRGALGKVTEAGAPSDVSKARAIKELLDELEQVSN